MRILCAVALLAALACSAHAATIFDGDPIDPATGRPYSIVPGLPLLLPQSGSGGQNFNPPVIDATKIGDVDLVVRADTLPLGATIPAPTATPPTVVAGGIHAADGSDIPFTVIASTGGTGVGLPLGGTSLDGIPVIVMAFADVDGDGIIGPTDADPEGATDDAREAYEAAFLVGRQAALFSGGIAQGSLAVWKGAPASAGGMPVVLTAVAFVGPYVSGSFVPDGPGVSTALPIFLPPDPKRLVDGGGRGGGFADPSKRLGFVFAPAYLPPPTDPVLGTAFALPTDGSNLTIDRAVVVSGPVSRARFVQPSSVADFPPFTEPPVVDVPVARGAGGALLAPRTSADVVDDGPGNGTHVQLVPVDGLDNPTDPPPGGVTATLVAGPGLVIAAPDTDGDPTRETVSLPSAAGIDITLDDTGGVNDSGAGSSLAVVMGGVPVESLAVTFTPGIGGVPQPPIIRGAVIVQSNDTIVRSCPAPKTIAAVVETPSGGSPTVSAALAVNGAAAGSVPLAPGALPPGLPLPAGPGFLGNFTLQNPAAGVLDVTVNASNAAGPATPVKFSVPIVEAMPSTVLPPALLPDVVAPKVKTPVVVTARVFDDCLVRKVTAEEDLGLGKGFRRAGMLRDDGRKGDAVAGDGIYTGTIKLKPPQVGTIPVHVVAKNRAKLVGTSPARLLFVQ